MASSSTTSLGISVMAEVEGLYVVEKDRNVTLPAVSKQVRQLAGLPVSSSVLPFNYQCPSYMSGLVSLGASPSAIREVSRMCRKHASIQMLFLALAHGHTGAIRQPQRLLLPLVRAKKSGAFRPAPREPSGPQQEGQELSLSFVTPLCFGSISVGRRSYPVTLVQVEPITLHKDQILMQVAALFRAPQESSLGSSAQREEAMIGIVGDGLFGVHVSAEMREAVPLPLLHIYHLRLGLQSGVREWQSPVFVPSSWGFISDATDLTAEVQPLAIPMEYERYREELISTRGGRKRGRKDGGEDFYTDAFWYFCPDQESAQERAQVEDALVDDSKTWEDVDWDVVRAAAARQCESATAVQMTEEECLTFESDARKHWNQFYQKHEDKFFQTRHYFLKEFPFLTPTEQPRRILEVGCGTGSTAFPLMEGDALCSDFWFLTDISDQAVANLKANPLYDERKRCLAMAHDITRSDLPSAIPGDLDIALLIFVLSAVSPDRMQVVLQRIYDRLRPGGQLIFRDYGLYDMVQMRFIGKGRPKLGDNFYLRSDGTRAYFFSLERCQELFAAVGFAVTSLSYDVRQLKNRRRKILFHRVWVRGLLQKPF